MITKLIGLVGCLACWILASWMMYDWHSTFGSFEDCPWFLITVCYCVGVIWFGVGNPEWKKRR